uniref:Uncharacterized protein n=1 Tax=Arundo donax TaxID=35708 RepID=A0A0A9I3C2_ARUDO
MVKVQKTLSSESGPPANLNTSTQIRYVSYVQTRNTKSVDYNGADNGYQNKRIHNTFKLRQEIVVNFMVYKEHINTLRLYGNTTQHTKEN